MDCQKDSGPPGRAGPAVAHPHGLARELAQAVLPVLDIQAGLEPRTDLVHGDFNAGNIFLLDGRISAVVDVEALGRGSRFHDLATLLVYARLFNSEPGACDTLLAYAYRDAAPGESEVSFAACLLGLLAFLTEHHPENAGTILRNAADHL